MSSCSNGIQHVCNIRLNSSFGCIVKLQARFSFSSRKKKEISYKDDRAMTCEDTDNLCSFLPDAAVCNQNEALIDEVKRRCPKTCATCPGNSA